MKHEATPPFIDIDKKFDINKQKQIIENVLKLANENKLSYGMIFELELRRDFYFHNNMHIGNYNNNSYTLYQMYNNLLISIKKQFSHKEKMTYKRVRNILQREKKLGREANV